MPVTTEPGAADTAAPVNGSHPERGFHFGVGWLAALLIVGLLLGAGGTLLAGRLVGHPGDTSPEAGFLRDMSTHHAQAVEMGMIAHQKSADVNIVTLAGDISLTQHGQIGYMQAWLRDWSLSPTGSDPPMSWMPDARGSVVNGLMPGMATPQQVDQLRNATGKQLDTQFLTLMRAHHLGGIHMAQGILEQSDNKDVRWLAETMVSGQQSELNLIDDLLKKAQASS
ncbi:DUF305 domain-containing protein [Actinoplanes sp. NPDC051633]|uniref:DUF305 domain-containing protein n=1 Tax=Actinoplanes sp. NPDC051633 TaxID=3155670 RepID=UPI003438C5E5